MLLCHLWLQVTLFFVQRTFGKAVLRFCGKKIPFLLLVGGFAGVLFSPLFPFVSPKNLPTPLSFNRNPLRSHHRMATLPRHGGRGA